MSRDMKFRGLTNANNTMVYGDLIHTPENTKRIIWFERKDEFDYKSFNEIVQPLTVGQFTGLLDKNGVEIYEGDIVKGRFEPMPSPNFHGTWNRQYEVVASIIYHNCGLCCFNLNKGNAKKAWIHKSINNIIDIEVIGNIHENPELLK